MFIFIKKNLIILGHYWLYKKKVDIPNMLIFFTKQYNLTNQEKILICK